jgi:hypothetical protein
MAKQHGIIPLTGTMGNISFVKTKDGYLARQKGGVDGSRIKNDPRFARTRENIAEFGRAGKAGKQLRKALRALVLRSADKRVTGRLTREMVKVIQADVTNVRGLRNVIDGEAELLLGFEFNIGSRLEATLIAPYTVTIDRATGNTGVQIPAFDPRLLIAAPQGATHARIVAGGAVIDFENDTQVAAISQSADIDLSVVNQPAINLANALTANSTSPIFVALGIEFYQRVNNVMYPLSNGAFNALTLVQVSGA